ncbi:uncharacterized protein DDB_G0271670-like [Tetranychus urticae]|uniref:uncharacterized protein DDB_G0271670-like n=1 Tax=Tetranychus urticae TaxID=32264 RepID=UPI00077B8AE2|nr:uncharacterized protein DDB_G0271670-like [Tetranychus urticae]
MMLMMKTKNSADHGSRLEEKIYPSSNNKPITSRKSDIESYSSHSEEVNINMSSKNLASSIMGPRQAWMDTDLSLENASLIEAIDEIARDCEKDREMNSLTGLISHQGRYASSASRFEKRLQELKSENEHLRSHRDFVLRRLIEGDYGMNTGKTKKVNKEAENTETRVKPTTTIENVENESEKEKNVKQSDSTVPTKEIPVSTDTSIKLGASSDVKTDSSELSRALEKEKTEIKDVSDKTDKPVDKNVAKANEPLFDKFKPTLGSMCVKCFFQNKPTVKCITCEKSKKNDELRLASKASPAKLNQQSKAHLPALINPLASGSETSKTITLTSSSSSTSTSSTPTTASSSLAFGKSTDSNKNLIMSTGSLGESSQTKISSSGVSSSLTKPISTTASVSRDETACTAAKLTSGSTSSAGTTSTSGFTFGQTPKTTQSSSSGLFFGSTSSNAPSSLASPGIQSNAFGQSSTSSFGASPSTSQAKQPASASSNNLSIASTTSTPTTASSAFVFDKSTASDNSLKMSPSTSQVKQPASSTNQADLFDGLFTKILEVIPQ